MENINTQSNTAADVVSKMHKKSDEILKSVNNTAHEGINKMSETFENVACHAEKYNEVILSYVEKNPLKSVLIAVAGGALAALLLKR